MAGIQLQGSEVKRQVRFLFLKLIVILRMRYSLRVCMLMNINNFKTPFDFKTDVVTIFNFNFKQIETRIF